MDARSALRRLLPCGATGTKPLIAVVAVVAAAVLAGTAVAREPRPADGQGTTTAESRGHAGGQSRVERHHRKQVGTASVYARRFGGRKMADGTRLNLNDQVAASRTLPLGTEARVTNLETGRSTQVTIQDRGPYAKGRILDLSPAAAETIGITPKEGVAKVEVQPLSVPPPKDERKDERKD
jgi:rare lipoprotein A